MMKLDSKKELNVLLQVSVFPADWEPKIASVASVCLRHF